MKIAINGFGRIGRLVFRQLLERDDLPPGARVVQVNDPGGDAANGAYLVNHDSVQGTWSCEAVAVGETIRVGEHSVRWSRGTDPASSNWNNSAPDVLIECSGRYKTMEELNPYLDLGIHHVLVSAPVSDPEVPNVVVGVNDDAFDPERHRCVSGASCTTNCVAPVLKVLHHEFGVVRGSLNTIHAVTPSQKVMDGFAKDMRRGRGGFNSMIPTTTGAQSDLAHLSGARRSHLGASGPRASRVPLGHGHHDRDEKEDRSRQRQRGARSGRQRTSSGRIGLRNPTARLGGLCRRLAFLSRGRTIDHGSGRAPREGLGVVRQRGGIQPAHG